MIDSLRNSMPEDPHMLNNTFENILPRAMAAGTVPFIYYTDLQFFMRILCGQQKKSEDLLESNAVLETKP